MDLISLIRWLSEVPVEQVFIKTVRKKLQAELTGDSRKIFKQFLVVTPNAGSNISS